MPGNVSVVPPGDPRRDSSGFTVIEMLVVMIIISILAAIAIPVIASQRGKARDTAVRADTRTLGQAVQEWFMVNQAPPAIQLSGGRLLVGGRDVAAVSDGTAVTGADPVTVDTTGWTARAWCLSLTNPDGALGTFRFSAIASLEVGACTSTTSP